MNVNPIKIEISDRAKYRDMALFLDNEKVLNEIYDIRAKWLNGETIPHDTIDDFINIDRSGQECKHFWFYYQLARKKVIEFKCTETYVLPFITAILSGIVADEDYSTFYKELPINRLPEELKFPTPIIYPSKRVSKSDIKSLLSKPAGHRELSTIERDRSWYWLKTSMSYKKIAKQVNKNIETVRTAIRTYRKKLKWV